MPKREEVGRITISGIISGLMYLSFIVGVIFLMLGGLFNLYSMGSGDYFLVTALVFGVIFVFTGITNIAIYFEKNI